LKLHNSRFDEECLGSLDKRKLAKVQWSKDPNESRVDNLNNVRREVSRLLRNKKKEYLKANIEDLKTRVRLKNITDFYMGVSDFKKRL